MKKILSHDVSESPAFSTFWIILLLGNESVNSCLSDEILSLVS